MYWIDKVLSPMTGVLPFRLMSFGDVLGYWSTNDRSVVGMLR
jgi:hypothetical protein